MNSESLLKPSPLIPASRPEIIQSLIDGVDRYNPDNVSILEEYLGTQLNTEDYDLMANLAILKLYQFNPHLVNEQVINNILVKSLTAIPNPDFNLCLYLLHENALADENVAKLVELQQLLEECKYQEFWKVYESDDSYKELTSDAIGFEDAIRKVILTSISMTYQSISAELLSSYLNLSISDEEFDSVIQSRNLVNKEGIVLVPTNYDNEAKPTVIRENIKFEQLTKVIGYSNEL
ncbi:ARM repeat-containing protein [Gigaspora margarita]|uniref:Eukaryotic translation initiation factor 3 subunit K n=1 Tax=Gigaspora margarita TaxID=4874 RepID=A0A8H4B2F5_GIGMA|nr:ARM repeat-containing protein [Gigaspora margarita]